MTVYSSAQLVMKTLCNNLVTETLRPVGDSRYQKVLPRAWVALTSRALVCASRANELPKQVRDLFLKYKIEIK